MYRKHLLEFYFNAINMARLALVKHIRTWSVYSQQLVVQPSPYSHLIDKAKENQTFAQREQFALALKGYLSLEKYRRGHMKFIKEGLIRMDEFNLQRDILTYNRLIDIFPKGKFNNKTMFDAFWPKPHPQIDLALEILQKMEDYGIRPDYNTYMLLCEIFGRVSYPVQKCLRIAVWFDKFENIDPYRIVGDMPTEPLVLSKMALERISGNGCQLWEVAIAEESEQASFVLAAYSQNQIKTLESIKINELETGILHVEGPHRIWLQKQLLFYYSVCLINKKKVQLGSEDMILGVCMCRPPTQDSLSAWINHLQKLYPTLENATVVYDVTVLEDMFNENENEMLKDFEKPPQLES